MNILFVCSRNKWRSPTAEAIYKGRSAINVKSAGTAPSARIKLTAGMINWADIIFVMEKKHQDKILENFMGLAINKCIVILHIPDEYAFMDEELIGEIEAGVEPYL